MRDWSETDLGYYDNFHIGNLQLENVVGDVNAGVGAADDHNCFGHLETEGDVLIDLVNEWCFSRGDGDNSAMRPCINHQMEEK